MLSPTPGSQISLADSREDGDSGLTVNSLYCAPVACYNSRIWKKHNVDLLHFLTERITRRRGIVCRHNIVVFSEFGVGC